MSLIADKTDHILNEIGQKDNKALMAKLYQDFNKKSSQQMLRNTFAKIMGCYKQENNKEILKELIRVVESVKSIMKIQNDDFMADGIAKEFIAQYYTPQTKERERIIKKENYKV